MIQIQENGNETHSGPKFGPPIFFSKNQVSPVTRYHDQVMTESWENLVTDGQTDTRE